MLESKSKSNVRCNVADIMAISNKIFQDNESVIICIEET